MAIRRNGQKRLSRAENAQHRQRAAGAGTNKEFALLRTLASEPRRVFTKDELLRDVWGFRSMGITRR